MSEVLSQAAVGLPARDERQSLRVARFLMAAGTSLVVCLALSICAFLDLLPWRAAIDGSIGIVALVALFYLLFRTGLNLRFGDPSLTTEQVAGAILLLAYIMYHAGPARAVLTPFYLVAMLFGVLRLNAARMIALALLALLAHATMLHFLYLRGPGVNPRTALAEFLVLAVILPWFAVMGGYVNRLRTRLSDSHHELQLAVERIGELAIRDELTGVYNRRYLMEALAREQSRAERLGTPFAVCLIDIDHFKSINDSFGHAAGDSVLKEFARLIPPELRGVDVHGRFGGEEFLIVLPGTDRAGAQICAERVRARTAAAAFPGVPRVTVTVGVAIYAGKEPVSALLARADKALYEGKNGGRNRVVTIG
ncbi:MAG: diguanylate cyclase [Betaproteobacteria bacterium]|jgi:diguanylate cyclase (GGDEF)-like protein|nr:diguanylate cyclase [Betaproteobacteria bacterium]